MTGFQPQTAQEKWALLALEELRLIRGELSGLRGDVKALRDIWQAKLSLNDNPAQAPVSTQPKENTPVVHSTPVPKPVPTTPPQPSGGKGVNSRTMTKNWK